MRSPRQPTVFTSTSDFSRRTIPYLLVCDLQKTCPELVLTHRSWSSVPPSDPILRELVLNKCSYRSLVMSNIELIIEPRMVSIFWSCSPIVLERITFWFPFSNPGRHNAHTSRLQKKGFYIVTHAPELQPFLIPGSYRWSSFNGHVTRSKVRSPRRHIPAGYWRSWPNWRLSDRSVGAHSLSIT